VGDMLFLTDAQNVKNCLTYFNFNWPEVLKKVFLSMLSHHVLLDEILIADDGSDDQTRTLIAIFENKLPIPIRHF